MKNKNICGIKGDESVPPCIQCKYLFREPHDRDEELCCKWHSPQNSVWHNRTNKKYWVQTSEDRMRPDWKEVDGK